MFGSFLNSIEVVIYRPLAIVVFATWNNAAYIATFYRVITVVIHQLVSLFHMTLVVAQRSRCLVVHHQFYAFAVCILIETFEVKVRIRSHEVKDIIFGVVKPIFPAYIPTLYKHLVKPMLSSEVNITAYFLVVSRMGAIGACFGVIYFVKIHGREIIGISPRRLTADHFPPYSYIFYRFDPRSIGECTRFVEV